MRLGDMFFEIQEGIAISLEAIRANALRSVLTTLGIIIGIVSVTLMGTAIEGLTRGFNSSIAKLGADVLYIQKFPWFGGDDFWKYRNRRDLKIKEFKAIERYATSIQAATPICGTRMTVKYKDRTAEGMIVVGANEKYSAVTGVMVGLGRFFTEAEADGGRPICVIGYDIAEKLFPNESPLGKTIWLRSVTFRIIGVLEKQGSFLGLDSLDNRLIIPLRAFLRKFGSRRGLDIFVKIKNIAKLEDTKYELRGILRQSRRLPPGAEDDFAINQQDMIINAIGGIAIIIAAVGLAITALSLFVGAIGIMNIMFVSVNERIREIGIRKALGARRRTILLQFLLEAAVLSLIGGILGLLVAYPLSLIINQFIPTSMPLSIVVLALGISSLVGIVSGFLPALRASRLDPVETLRYE